MTQRKPMLALNKADTLGVVSVHSVPVSIVHSKFVSVALRAARNPA